MILYNIALILQKLASQLLRDEKSTLTEVLQAVHELGISHKYFQYLAVEGDKQKYDLGRAAVEARQCQVRLTSLPFWFFQLLVSETYLRVVSFSKSYVLGPAESSPIPCCSSKGN